MRVVWQNVTYAEYLCQSADEMKWRHRSPALFAPENLSRVNHVTTKIDLKILFRFY